ncbi:MAG: 5'-nucleotidase C-terminal domain-containing protein [Gemmatimonadaceae bacterium]
MKAFAVLAVAFVSASCAATVPPASSTGGSRGGASGFELLVLSTTDVHGHIRGWDYYANAPAAGRGLTRAATVVDSVRASNPGRVVLVDAGDLLQGNPFADVSRKQFADSLNPIISAMNAMRYDAAAIGNHEYNYGVPYLQRAVAQARFALLSANTYRPNGAHAFRAWTIVERRGVKIGIIGATTPGVMVWDAENVKGRITVGDIVPAVRQAVQGARVAGADIIMVTMHAGLDGPSSYDTVASGLPSENVAGRVAAEIPGIDLIVYGHSHREQKNLKIGSTLLVQPRNWAMSVGVAHLQLAREGNGWKVASAQGETIQSAARAESQTVIDVSAAAHKATVAYANTVIGSTRVAWRADSSRLRDTPLIDFMLEVMRKTAGADLASTAAFSTDASLDTGSITVAEMARLYPYDNTLRAVRINGQQLRDYLEFSARYYKGATTGPQAVPVPDPEIPGYNFDIVSGVDYTIDLARPIGSRITTLSIKGRPVAPSDSFTMALNNYRQTGGGGFSMLRGAAVVYDKQLEIRQLLIDEVTKQRDMRPAIYFSQNWSLIYPGAALSPAGGESQGGPLPAGTPRLRVIATNDFHGALEPRPDANGVMRGGAAYVAAVIKKTIAECAPECETLLLDGGDMFQGTPASNFAFGRPVVEYYNRLGYAAAALGNHEFDWGVDSLRARMKEARFAILGANVRFKDGRDVPWIRDDTLVVRGALKIGVIGIATRLTPTTTRAANVLNLRFDDPVPVVNARARSLRERGADMVIVVAHDGGFCAPDGVAPCRGEIIDIAGRLTEKIDAIVSGHSHSVIDVNVKGVPIVQARSSGRSIGVIDIPLQRASGALGAYGEVRDVVTTGTIPEPGIDSLVRLASRRVAALVNRPIARFASGLSREGSQYPLGNIIADAQRWAGKGDVAIMNNGGIRAGLRDGIATYGSLYEVQPFGNTLYRLSMRGSNLRSCLERIMTREQPRVHVSGITIGFNPAGAIGQKIVSLALPAGRTLAANAVYTVIVNDFIATSTDDLCSMKDAIRSTPIGITDLEALTGYLATLRSPIQPPVEARIVIRQ